MYDFKLMKKCTKNTMRNIEILIEKASGIRSIDLGLKYGLSRTRIDQIIKNHTTKLLLMHVLTWHLHWSEEELEKIKRKGFFNDKGGLLLWKKYKSFALKKYKDRKNLHGYCPYLKGKPLT